MQLTTATPAQIDAEIARIDGLFNEQYARFEKATKVIDSEYSSAERVAAAERVLVEVTEATNALRDEVAPLHAEFQARGGWERWYLVEGGHLHYDVSAYRCSRIQSTSHYWLVDYSGTDRAAMIELAGERVCTVCFPEAPAAVQERPSRLFTKTEAEKAEARREREDKRTQAAATKAAKAITAPDGSVLLVPSWGSTDKVLTEADAQSRYRNALAEIGCLTDPSFELARAKSQTVEEHEAFRARVIDNLEPQVEILEAALAAKHGISVKEERARHAKPIAAKIRRDLKEAAGWRASNPSLFVQA